jgi:ubiquinone/menaquinone biosynthesis C-methylase UbiE
MDCMENRLTDEQVRRTFARQVDLFAASDSPFGRRSLQPTSWLEPLEASMIVLDVACGAAHATDQVAPHVRQVVGLDLTPDLLAIGDERVRQAGIGNVLLQEGNAAALPFVDSSFDLVFCRSALHHFRKPRATVREMARVCRRGGRVVVSDVVAPGPEVREAFDDLHRAIDPSHMRAFLTEEIVELLASEVGPICGGELSGPTRLLIDQMLTDASGRELVKASLSSEINGGDLTGFEPRSEAESGRISVSFISAIVHASKVAPG